MDQAAVLKREIARPALPCEPRGGAIARWWSRRRPARLNLALQGGGAHGAFTWGVLDALLTDPLMQFEGLSGSSAGAMNAVVLADGWLKGGREGARHALDDFWATVGRQLPSGMVVNQGEGYELSSLSKTLAHWAGQFSPAQINPLEFNPLRGLLEGRIDFERLRAKSPFKLFIGATRAASGQLRVFREHELTLEVLLASACLPRIHHAVEIDGEPYWDGGYSANPAVFPLFYDCESRDVLLVLLSPSRRDEVPRTVPEINARIAELGFNAPFLREMRMFARANAWLPPRLFSLGPLERRLRGTRFHLIDTTELASLQQSATQALAYGPFLQALRDQGRERGAAWLAEHGASVGRRSSFDVQQRFG